MQQECCEHLPFNPSVSTHSLLAQKSRGGQSSPTADRGTVELSQLRKEKRGEEGRRDVLMYPTKGKTASREQSTAAPLVFFFPLRPSFLLAQRQSERGARRETFAGSQFFFFFSSTNFSGVQPSPVGEKTCRCCDARTVVHPRCATIHSGPLLLVFALAFISFPGLAYLPLPPPLPPSLSLSLGGVGTLVECRQDLIFPLDADWPVVA